MATSDPGSGTGGQSGPSKAERRAARAAVGAYREAELAQLLEHVREGLERYDAGEIDAFELDELIHHSKQATQKLWSFCTGGGAHVDSTARTLDWLREQGELPDWWTQATPRRARRRPAATAPISEGQPCRGSLSASAVAGTARASP